MSNGYLPNGTFVLDTPDYIGLSCCECGDEAVGEIRDMPLCKACGDEVAEELAADYAEQAAADRELYY